jgi:hypothetical protein
MELRRELLTAEMAEPGTGRPVRTTIEVRTDPLTGFSSRILPERGLMPAADFDQAAFARESQPDCPFCPDLIDRLTPLLPENSRPAGGSRAARRCCSRTCTPTRRTARCRVYSPRRHYLPLGDMTQRLLADNLAAQVAYAKAVMAADPGSRWASVNANHMLPSGSSLFHPHMQGVVDSQPTTMPRLAHGLRLALGGYAEQGFESFNFAIYGAPPGTEGYPLNLRLACRSNLRPFYRSDSTFLERLHWEGAVDLAPETVARWAGPRFRA